MMSITDTNIPTPETIAQDWNAVVQHAKDMQLAIGRFTSNLQLAVNEDHAQAEFAKDIAFYADQLNDAGDAILHLTETISKDVEPLIELLLKESSDDKAEDITKTIASAQSNAIKALGASALEIASSAPPVKEPVRQDAEMKPKELSPEAQAIKDGFERILGGKPDSRMGYGKLPSQ